MRDLGADDGEMSREEAIFCDALAIEDRIEREAFLRRECGSHGSLREAVDALLSSAGRADGLFRSTSASLKPPTGFAIPLQGADKRDPNEGLQLGPYKLAHAIGGGGCGVVYLAIQESPVRRSVALKILKLGLDTMRVMARFEAERQTLAMMEHPNIAHVLDAGATETGRPYFVMELVRGQSITDFSAQHSLPLVERLRLFQQVCHAVEHAHQKGIIHRDLKPSNILVASREGAPVPKVIDFGIAKALGSTPSATLATQSDQLMGTPAYMSPEQAQGGWVDVDTRSDIYSLGVVLYELLVGQPPFRNDELLCAGVDEMRRRLLTEEPLRPSTQAARSAAAADFDAGYSANSLRGDLDSVVMKALEKDRNRRYQTVRGLRLDLERFLANEPVEARPPSHVYRLQKLIQRNKVAFAGISVGMLALLIGLCVSTWLYFKAAAAERQQQGLRAVAEQALEEEARLRQQAEKRERLARASILLVERRFAEANALVREIPSPIERPSVEAANVFRALTEWNFFQSDVTGAVQRALSLLEVNRFHQSDQPHLVTRDYVIVAPVLLETGERALYESLRAQWVREFSHTSNAVAAEQILKACLLIPPNHDLLTALAPLAALQRNCVADGSASVLDRAWGSTAAALFEYRREDYGKGAEWAARSRRFNYRNKAHQALCLSLEAICRWQRGEETSAKTLLEESHQLLEAWFSRPSRSPENGAWNDWLIARILFREAAQRITFADGQTLPLR